jgi:hypothetical protein
VMSSRMPSSASIWVGGWVGWLVGGCRGKWAGGGVGWWVGAGVSGPEEGLVGGWVGG